MRTSVFGSKLYLFGGYAQVARFFLVLLILHFHSQKIKKSFLADAYVWDYSSNHWTRTNPYGPELPTGVYNSGMSCLNSYSDVTCFAFGGDDGDYGKTLDSLWKIVFKGVSPQTPKDL